MDISEIRRRNLSRLLRERFAGKQVNLANALDRQPGYISRCLSTGKHRKRIGEDFARDIEQAVGLEPGWLDDPSFDGSTVAEVSHRHYELAPKAPSEHDYALIPQLSAKGQNGTAGYLNDHVEVKGGLAFKRAWLAKMHVKPANLSIIYAEGASMEPYIIEGDVVLIDHGCVEPINGQVYAIRRPDGGVSIKRLIQQVSGEWILSSDNPNKARYRDEPVGADSVCQVPIIGRVVWRGGAMA